MPREFGSFLKARGIGIPLGMMLAANRGECLVVPETNTMTVQELITELSKRPMELPILVASTPADDQCPLEFLIPHEITDNDHVLLCGCAE